MRDPITRGHETQVMVVDKWSLTIGKIPPRILDSVDRARRKGMLDQWFYKKDAEHLLGSERGTTSYSAWDVLWRERQYLKYKSGVPRIVGEIRKQRLRSDEAVLRISSAAKAHELASIFLQIKLDLGAHGVVVIEHPVPGLQERYAVLRLDSVNFDYMTRHTFVGEIVRGVRDLSPVMKGAKKLAPVQRLNWDILENVYLGGTEGREFVNIYQPETVVPKVRLSREEQIEQLEAEVRRLTASLR